MFLRKSIKTPEMIVRKLTNLFSGLTFLRKTVLRQSACFTTIYSVFLNACHYAHMLGQVFYTVFLNACHYAHMIDQVFYIAFFIVCH